MEAGVFKQQNLPGLQLLGGFPGDRADAIIGESHRRVQQAVQIIRHRTERKAGPGNQQGAQDRSSLVVCPA